MARLLPILALFVIILAPLGLAEESFVFKKNQFVNYEFKCVDETSNYCSTGTILTISIDSSNGTNLFDNSTMTANPTYFNHSLPTEDNGRYTVIITSPNGNATSEFKYLVTPTGFKQSTAQGLTSGIVLFVVFLLGVVSLVTGFVMFDFEGYYWFFGLILIGFGVGMFIYTLSLANIQISNISYGTGTENTQEGILTTFMVILKVLTYSIIPFFLFYAWARWKGAKKEKLLNDGWDGDRY